MINVLRKSFVNFRGWTTPRKLFLIESDDWGSIRMPNKKVYNHLLSLGLPVDSSRYSKFDTLEFHTDLERLFETLHKVKDQNGNAACFTANYLVANPDFEKIKNNDFKKYYYEDIFQTYDRYGKVEKIKNHIITGIKDNIFYPQFHGREHIHPLRWMFAVNNCPIERICFDNYAIPGVPLDCSTNTTKKYLASFDYYDQIEKKFNEEALVDGLKIFEQIFGFQSRTFIAPQSVRGLHLDSILYNHGVLYHQNGQQLLPSMEDNNNAVINKYWGYKNDFGMLYWRRNVTFEPSKNPNFDSVSLALNEIKNAFFFGKPAVLNSHRVNFIGSISEKNQIDSLQKLEQLLTKVVQIWPEVEFVNSQQLGEYMSSTI